MRRLVYLGVLLLVKPVLAESPVPVEKVISADDLVAEVQYQLEQLNGFVASEGDFAKANEKKKVAQAAGTIACLAQALVEHDDAPEKIAAEALRDAALTLKKPDSIATTKTAIETMQAAMQGKGEGAAEHDWAKLINLHRMMEEMNARNSQIRRIIRRPKDAAEDSRHASTQAVLGLALIADTHEVKNPDDLPEWNRMATEYQATMSELAKALRSGNLDQAKELYATGAKSCSTCHEKFRH